MVWRISAVCTCHPPKRASSRRIDLCHDGFAPTQLCTWLSGIGLQLNASKSRIGHTLHAIDACVGFGFLGFSIRHYATGKIRLRRDRRLPRWYKLLIKPSAEGLATWLRREPLPILS